MTRKSSKQLKFVAFIMSLVMLMTVSPRSAFAENGVIDTSEAIDQVLSGDEIISDVEPAAVDNVVTLTAADVPEFIALSDLTTRGTVRRLYEEEADLSTILFENNDGTRTLYMYGVPVKYVAPDGTTRDKSTAISTLSGLQALWSGTALTPNAATTLAQSASIGRLDLDKAADALALMNTRLSAAYGSELTLSDMAYASLDSDIRSLYPTAAIDGIVLNYGDYSIRTIPAGGNQIVLGNEASIVETTSLTDNDTRTRVRYNGAFGAGTVLQYTPTTMGVKEEVILTSNVGKNAFSFLIETGGLTIAEENGSYYFFDPETGSTVARLGEVIAYDSNGQIARGAIEAVTIREGQQYGVTISVSEEFLAEAVYPVSVDPTITVINQSTQSIEDIGIYNGSGAWNYTFESAPYIGDSTLSDHLGAMLYRFPFIYDDSVTAFSEPLSNAAQIGEATLNLYVTGGTGYPVTLRTKASTVSWSDNGMRICDAAAYSAAMNGSNSYESTVSVALPSAIEVDITKIMRSWYNYENNLNVGELADPEKGLLLYATDTSDRLDIGTMESYSTYYLPYLTVNYITAEQTGPYYINNKGNQKFLTCTTSMTPNMEAGRVIDLGESMEWMLYYMGDSKYALSPVMYDGLLFMNYLGELSVSPIEPADQSMWTMITDNTDYVFRNVSFTTRALSYEEDIEYNLLTVSWATLATSVTDINSSAITNDCKWRLVRKDEYAEVQVSSTYSMWVAPNEMVDLYEHFGFGNYSLTSPVDLSIYPNDLTKATVSDNVLKALMPDTSFTLYFDHHPTDRVVGITVNIGAIAEGTYFFLNSEYEKYMQIDDDSAVSDDTFMELWEIDIADDQKWTLQLLSTGYYKIISVASGKSLTAPSTLDQSITQTDYRNLTTQQWRISISDGMYKLSPRSNVTYYIAAGDGIFTSDGRNVEMREAQPDGKDEWNLVYINRLNIRLEMDYGYLIRYGGSESARTRIAENLTAVRDKYAEYFGICIDFSEVTLISSYADSCTTVADYDIPCTHCETGECENSTINSNGTVVLEDLHHKNIYNIMARFDFPDIESEVLVAFIGHNTCAMDGTTHDSSGYYGLTFSTNGIISITNFVSAAEESKTTMHEIGHLFEAPDHYDIGDAPSTEEINDENPDYQFSEDCIYGENKDEFNIYSNYVICEGCQTKIKENANRFNH